LLILFILLNDFTTLVLPYIDVVNMGMGVTTLSLYSFGPFKS